MNGDELEWSPDYVSLCGVSGTPTPLTQHSPAASSQSIFWLCIEKDGHFASHTVIRKTIKICIIWILYVGKN